MRSHRIPSRVLATLLAVAFSDAACGESDTTSNVSNAEPASASESANGSASNGDRADLPTKTYVASMPSAEEETQVEPYQTFV